MLAAVTVGIVLVLLAADDGARAPAVPAAASRPLEFICIFPITMPAIVLVVGLAPVYSVGGARVRRLAPGRSPSPTASLVLPFAYRSIQATSTRSTRKDSQRGSPTLGAGWMHRAVQVLLPNLRRGTARGLVHLGGRRARRVHDREPAQPRQPADRAAACHKYDPWVAVIFALLALALAFVLLLIIGRLGAATPLSEKRMTATSP